MKLEYKVTSIDFISDLTFIRIEVTMDEDSFASCVGLPVIKISVPRLSSRPLAETKQEALAFARRFLNESALADWMQDQQPSESPDPSLPEQPAQ